MHRYDPARQRLAIGLAGLAGLVDATGFVVAGGYFTSFMSGNTTRLGVDLTVTPAMAAMPLAMIGCFLSGVIAGALVLRRLPGRHKRALLGLIALILGLATASLWADRELPFLALAAIAMGLANNVFSRNGEVTVGVTYMTGALVKFGQGLAARLAGQSLPATRGYGLLWITLATGAALGGWLCSYDTAIAASAAALLAVLLCGIAFWIERGSPNPRD